MKRSSEEVDPVQVNRLRELFLRLPPDAIENVLANLDVETLYLITHKIPDLPIVSDLLNAPNAFRRLYDIRKTLQPRSSVSYLEEDLVAYLPTPINYWHVFLCATIALQDIMPSLVDKAGTIRVFLSGQLLDVDQATAAHQFEVRMKHYQLAPDLQTLYDGAYAKYAPPARKYQLILQNILGMIARPPARYARMGNQMVIEGIFRVAGLRLGDFTMDTFGETLTLHNDAFRPENLLRSEGLYALFNQLQNQYNVLHNVAMGADRIEKAKQIVPAFQRYFNAVVSYLVLDKDAQTFLEMSAFRSVSGIRACIACNDENAQYRDTQQRTFCSKDCQEMWYNNENFTQ